MLRLQKLPAPQGVAANETATLRIPLGPTYNALFLELYSGAGPTAVSAANMDAGISEIRLIVDGDVKIRGSAAFFRKRAAYYGEPFVAGMLPIFLVNPWARTIGGEDSTGYGTVGGSMAQFTLEVDFTGTLTTPTMQVYADQSDPKPFGRHLRIQKYADNYGFIGVHEMVNIPALGPHRLTAIHIESTDIGQVEVDANNVRQHFSTALLRSQRLQSSGRVPQAGFTHLDFVTQNRMDESLPLALTDFRIKASFTAAPGAFNIYAETIQDDNIR